MTWYAATNDVTRSYEKPNYPFASAVAKQLVEEVTDIPAGDHEVQVQDGIMGAVETFKVSVVRMVYVRRLDGVLPHTSE